MQNLKSLLLSGCEGKQKHQMAAEKTRDNESGWEVWSNTKDHVGSAGLCQGSCSCLRAHRSELGMGNGNSSAGSLQDMVPEHPASAPRAAPPSSNRFPGLHIPRTQSGAPCWHLFVTRGSELAGHKPQLTPCGAWSAQSWCSGGKGLEQLGRAGSECPGAGSTHRAWHWGGSRAERVQSIWDGMGLQIPDFWGSKDFEELLQTLGLGRWGNSCRDFTGEILSPVSVPAASSQPHWGFSPSQLLWNRGKPEESPISLPG